MYGGHGGSGVGVTLEVRLHRLLMVEYGGRGAEKILGWLTRGGESEFDVEVGVTLEGRLHRFEKSDNGGREVGKNRMIGRARSGIRI